MRMLSPTTTITTTPNDGFTATSSHSRSHSYKQQIPQLQQLSQQQPQQPQRQHTLPPPCRRYPTCPRYPHKHSSLPRPCVRVQLEIELQLDRDSESSRHRSRTCTSTSAARSTITDTGRGTTLSQRLRRAIINDDLPAAKRVAKAARELAETCSQRVPPAGQGSGLGSSRARRREGGRQRERLRVLGEECLLPLAAAGAPQDEKMGRERLVFDIRNVKTQDLEGYSARTASTPATAFTLERSYPPLAGSKLPSPPYPLDCLIAEQDARKTSLQLAIEYRCSVAMIQWLLQCGHEELPTAATSAQGATLRITRDEYGRTIFHLAAIFDRSDVMQAYYAHVQGRIEEGSLSLSGATKDTSLSRSQDRVEDKQDAQQSKVDVDSRCQADSDRIHEQSGDNGEYEPVDNSKARRCSDSLSLKSSAYSSTHRCAESSDTPLLQLINAPDDLTSSTALHEAASRGSSDLCLLLLSYGAQIDCLDIFGNTPLHLASANGHPTCVHLLIDRGANFGVRNEMGCSPADVAYTDSDRATLEAMGRNSVALRKEKRKEERMAKAALSSEKARNGAEGQSFEGQSASASQRSLTPEVSVASGSGWGGESAFSSLALASSPLPEAARSTSALVTGRTAWFDEDGLEDLLLGSNSASTSVERTSPRSRLASFPRLASRNSTLMTATAPLSPSSASEGPSGGGSAGAGLLDARVLRLARRSSSALRLWAGYGLGRSPSPALGNKTTRDNASVDSYNSSTTADPRTPTSFSFETRSSLGSPKALHAQHFIGHSPQPFRSSAAPLGTSVSLSSPAAAPNSTTSTSSTFAQRSHPPRPFRYLKASRSSTALASAFRQTAAPSPSVGVAQAQAHAHTGLHPSGGQDRTQARLALRLRPRSIDLSSSTSLSLSVPGPGTRGLWTNNGGATKVATATALTLHLAADDSATEELATPTSPVAELGGELGSRNYEKEKEKRKRSDSGRVDWGQGRGEAYRHYGGGGTSRGEYDDLQQTPTSAEGGLRVVRGQNHARSPSIDWRPHQTEREEESKNDAQTRSSFVGEDISAHLSLANADATLDVSAALQDISTTSTSTGTAARTDATPLFFQTQQSGTPCAAVHVQSTDERGEEDKHDYPIISAPASAPASGSGSGTYEGKSSSSVALASYLASTPVRPPRRVRDGGRDERPRGTCKGSARGKPRSRSRTRPRTRPSTAGSK